MEFKNLFELKKNTLIGLFFFILLNCIVIVHAFAQSYPYKFKYITVDEGLSHTDANDLAQDNEGYIWVGTNFGLDRFDGYAIKKYYNTNVPINNAPKNRIVAVYPDGNGNIWLGTEDGLQCFNSNIEKYTDFTLKKDRTSPLIVKIFKPAGNLLYCFTDNNILKVYLINGNSLTEQKLNIPPGTRFTDMMPDKKGTLYFSSNNGLYSIKNTSFKKIPIVGLLQPAIDHIYFDNKNNLLAITGNQIFLVKNQIVTNSFVANGYKTLYNIASDSKTDYWVNTGSSLLRLNSQLNYIQTVSNTSLQYALNSNVLAKVYIDRSECLWVCTAGGGVNYCDLNQKLFYTLKHIQGDNNSLSGNHIRSVVEDGENLWIGTNAHGLNQYNLKTQKFTFYNSSNSPVKLKSDIITALMLDNQHNLWVGSTAGFDILTPNRKQLWRPKGYEKFPTYLIETIAVDCYGNTWFGNHTKFGVIWKDANNAYHVKQYTEAHFILTDKTRPMLFASSRHGLKQITFDKEGNIIKTIYYKASLQPNSLSSSYTSPVSRQNDTSYWIGTMGGGLNNLALNPQAKSYLIKSFAGKYGIFNDVESLEIDNNGNIWLGGNELLQLNPKTSQLIKYDKSDGLQGNSFKVRASYKGADGRLYFGGINGLNYFYPDQIKPNIIEARPALTDILINNKKPVYGAADSSKNTLNNAVGHHNDLTLNYRQNNFIIFFSAMHFANPLKCKYRYKLIGFDKEWQYTDGKNPSAAYNNLDYSNYKFIVEATNNDGLWSKNSAETAITITPPWWKSDFAKLVYILLFVSALSAIYIYQARWYRLKREVEVRALNAKKREEMHQQREEMHQQREELYQQQLLFFTNISHEFRTPLTLILGPLENLISQNKDTTLDSSYQIMLRNAKRLINLISELMNFKKVSDSLIKLQIQPLIIDQFCNNMAQEFQGLAVNKQINFKMLIHGKKTPFTGHVDIQILEKILFNLLNNAFKYTDAGGKISFEIFFEIDKFKPAFSEGFKLLNKEHRAKKYIYFKVSDSGIGISSDSINRIFDRYYRISKDHLGSGVGLALVKSLTQLHKGDIYVYSERHKGTEIIIGIPWGKENYTEAEITAYSTGLETQLEVIDNSILLPVSHHQSKAPVIIPKTNKHILIVDDNEELRTFLKQTFEQYYYIYEAENGYAAIEIATDKVPDIIISDVMMPGMDGIELCHIIKQKEETKHIPFIILSAKDALATKIEGLESGADFYFAKPLSVDLLLLTVNNIFEQGEKLKLRYTNDYLTLATSEVHSEKDKDFFNRLLNLIEDNIKDPDLDVDFLCQHLFISRTKLYQQIKNISDQSVGEFIRVIRLKKAIQIMTHEDISMSEVADRIGLQSSSNFSRTFKKEYGRSPLQFMQALKAKASAAV